MVKGKKYKKGILYRTYDGRSHTFHSRIFGALRKLGYRIVPVRRAHITHKYECFRIEVNASNAQHFSHILPYYI